MSDAQDNRGMAYDGAERRSNDRRTAAEYSHSIHLNPLIRDRRKVEGRREEDQRRWPGFEI